MKMIIVYLLALLALVHGEEVLRGQSYRQVQHPRYGNPIKYLLRTRREKQICVPESKYEGVCEMCACSEDGTKIICVNSGLCPHPPRHRRDTPSVTELDNTIVDKSCTICTCALNGLCTMKEYEICPTQLHAQ